MADSGGGGHEKVCEVKEPSNLDLRLKKSFRHEISLIVIHFVV